MIINIKIDMIIFNDVIYIFIRDTWNKTVKLSEKKI